MAINTVAPQAHRDSRFRIGLVQMACSTEPEANMQKAIRGIREAAAKGAEIVCLQELFEPVFLPRRECAVIRSGGDDSWAVDEALVPWRKNFSIVIVASLFERRAQGSITIRPR